MLILKAFLFRTWFTEACHLTRDRSTKRRYGHNSSMDSPGIGLYSDAYALWRRVDIKRDPLVDTGASAGVRKALTAAGGKPAEKTDDQLNDIFILTIFGPALFVAIFVIVSGGVKPSGFSVAPATVFIVAGAIGFVFLVWRLTYLIARRRNYRLGFAGERAVAEELNQLMLDGCRVFHDVPIEPYGNIDHVLVTPTGIYAVETKARRKRKASKGRRDHEVVFDGKALQFPCAVDLRSLDQARRQADQLRVFLSNAVGEPVKVGAILTLPGWFVTSRVKVDIKVLNPRGIGAAVLDGRVPALSRQLIDRVVYQLDRKCRDVEF